MAKSFHEQVFIMSYESVHNLCREMTSGDLRMPMRCGVPVGTGSVLGAWKNVLQQKSLLSGFGTFFLNRPLFLSDNELLDTVFTSRQWGYERVQR